MHLIFFLWIFSLQALPHLAFDFSMSAVPYYQSPDVTHHEEWQLLKELYDNYHALSRPSAEYRIPKLIHLIWLGSPLPERCKRMVASWIKFHPDWIVKVWNDDDAAFFPFINRDAFNRAKNWGEKSDIWRYEILYRFGGLYVDTDFECLQPFDELHKSCELYTGIGQHTTPQLWIGIIGTRPGHPILKAAIENLRAGPGDQDFERIMEDTGVYLFTRVFFDIARTCTPGTIVPFPVTFFYPFPGGLRYYRKDEANIKHEFVRPETMAIHYFATSWQQW